MQFSSTKKIFTGSRQNPIQEMIDFLHKAKELGATHLVVDQMTELGGQMRYDAKRIFTEEELRQQEIAELEKRLLELKSV